MNFTISGNSINFEIEYDGKEYLIFLDGGEWRINKARGGKYGGVFLAQGRVSFSKVLQRAWANIAEGCDDIGEQKNG